MSNFKNTVYSILNEDATETQRIKDAKVETSSGVKRSLTAAEAQQAAKDANAGVESPFGNARPGDGQLTPEEQARINQVQQNPGDTTSRSAFKVKEQIDSNKIFNRTTGQWEQGGPPRSKGAPRPTGFNPYQHIDGMRDEEDTGISPPYNPAKEEEERIKIRMQVNDITIKNAIQKEIEDDEFGDFSIDDRRNRYDAQRAKIGLDAIDPTDFKILEKEKAKTKKDNVDDFSDEWISATRGYKTFGQVAAEGLKAKNDEQAAERRAKRDAHHDSEQSTTFKRGSNGVQIRDQQGSRGSSSDLWSRQNPTKATPTQQSEYASTVTSSTPSVSLQAGPRDQSILIAAYSANRSKNKNPAMQTAGYSYNKALTFFAEQLKRKYIEEEVVNPENQPMSKSEISHRDRIRHKSPAKDARIVKSADKTKENAAYRLATYITMRGRKGKKKENK